MFVKTIKCITFFCWSSNNNKREKQILREINFYYRLKKFAGRLLEITGLLYLDRKQVSFIIRFIST